MSDNVFLNWESSDKFYPVLGQYLIQPGTCAGCNKPPGQPDEPFISLVLELEFYGCVYLCLSCSKAIGAAIGWSGPDDTVQLERANHLLRARNANLLEQVDFLKELLNVRVNAGGPSESGIDGFISIPFPAVESDPIDTDSEIDGRESESVESGQK